nr:hypothetical protein [Streptomyces corynorhini]
MDLDEEKLFGIRSGEADLGTWDVPDGVGDEFGSNELGIVDDQGIETPSVRDPSDRRPDERHGSIGLDEVHPHMRIAKISPRAPGAAVLASPRRGPSGACRVRSRSKPRQGAVFSSTVDAPTSWP